MRAPKIIPKTIVAFEMLAKKGMENFCEISPKGLLSAKPQSSQEVQRACMTSAKIPNYHHRNKEYLLPPGKHCLNAN